MFTKYKLVTLLAGYCFIFKALAFTQVECEKQPSLADITQFFDSTVSLSSKTSEQGMLEDVRPKKFSNYYRKCIAPSIKNQLANLKDKQTFSEYFTQLNYFVTMTKDAKMQPGLTKAFEFGQKQGFLGPSDIEQYYYNLIALRQFSIANELAEQYANITLDPLPQVRHTKISGRVLYRLNEDASQMSPIAFSFPPRGHVVIVSSPMCQFCRQLFKDLKQQPSLRKTLVANATWITPSDGYLYLPQTLVTQQLNPGIKMHYTHSQSQWPEITYWGTPTFYFYYDGQLQKQVLGWPRKGNVQALTTALQIIGLL